MTGQRILVTGGAGFIGSHIVDDLLALGCEVSVFDNLSSGFHENLPATANRLRFIEGDVRDAAAVVRAAEGMDAISHHAAQLEITTCLKDPAVDLDINTRGTLNVLRAAAHWKVSKVVYASSACVYGQATQDLQTEEHPTLPNWAYGVSKLAAEHYARLSAQMDGIQTIGLRYAIVYGPREWYGRALTVFLARALVGQAPVVWGRGKAMRDFIHVEDAVRLHRAALNAAPGSHRVYNVSTGIGTSIAQLATLVTHVASLTEPIIYENLAEGDMSQHVSGRLRLPAELQHMVLSCKLACHALQWTPRRTLGEGLAEEWRWAQSHRHLWDKLRY